MANTLGKIVKSGKDKFTKWDSKLNFVIPENMATYHGINGKKDDRNLVLGEDNFRFQIGKMDKKNETIYSKEIILGGLEYLLKKKGNDKKIVIQLRPDLARYLCNEDQKDNLDTILDFEQEKVEIEKFINKYFKKKAEDIQIINISDQYPEIFNLLKEQGSIGLKISEEPNLDYKKFSALNLLKYLYRVSRNNKKFMQIIYNTKSHKQKQEDAKPIGENESDYYALVEVAIRMYEVIKGINIQGGIDRQTKYDRIIGGILYGKDIDNFKIKDYQELSRLHDFCKQVNPQIEFERVYVTTKEVREIAEKKHTLSKIQTSIIITSVALFSILAGGVGGYYIAASKQKADQKKLEDAITKSVLDASSIYFYGLNTKYETGKDIEKKQEYFDSMTNTMFSFLCEICGPTEEENRVKSVIKDELLRVYDTYETSDGEIKKSRNIERFYHLPLDYSIMGIKDFVIDILIPNNKVILSTLGYNPIPYNNFLEYKSDFENTLSTKGDLIIKSNKISGDFMDKNSTGSKFKKDDLGGGLGIGGGYHKKYIGKYYDYTDYDYYYFVQVTAQDGKTIILAVKNSSGSLEYGDENIFSLKDAQEGIQKIQKYRSNK